ncbi:YlmC/YmxH family sporulation protein [Wukongibacter baidiensis]|uniref:YlmC/YmxH family sporulation protein n=1 Tax=Wukongibacter baidiensis TaxID=1723361 RepID=UPI003D7F2340
MVTTSDLRMKEVINVANGSRIGFIYDFEINLEKNRVEAIVVPSEGKFLKIFNKDSDQIIPWKRIVKIGEDVILVEIKEPLYYDEEEKESKDLNFILDNILEKEEDEE